MRDRPASIQDLIDHPFHEFPRAGRQCVEHVTSLRHLAQSAPFVQPQRCFHMAEALDERDDLNVQFARSAVEEIDLLRRVGAV